MDTDVAGQGTAKVRLSKSLSKGEKAATASRKEKIKEALTELKIPYDSDTVPNIAVMGSGGGLRAMIALCGTLVELKDQNLLDCVMYLSGVSGSAWCISSLYKTENWTERLKELEQHQRESLIRSQFDFDAAITALLRAANDKNYSLTDFWAYFVVHQMLNKLDETTLSEHRRSSESGINPYPIYAAVNNKTYPEDLAGLWGSALGSKQDMTRKIYGALGLFRARMRQYSGFFHLLHQLHNVLLRTTAHLRAWKWGTTDNLLYKCCDAEVYNFSSEQTISLIDAGLAMNIAYPLILCPERNVKLILSFDFSSGNPFMTIEKAADHCEKHRIKFPQLGEITSQDRKNPSACYIFRGKDAPTIMHFPLFNKDNCPGKIAEYTLQFGTAKTKYSKQDIEKLLIAAKKNVVNARQKIWEEIERAVAPSS